MLRSWSHPRIHYQIIKSTDKLCECRWIFSGNPWNLINPLKDSNPISIFHAQKTEIWLRSPSIDRSNQQNILRNKTKQPWRILSSSFLFLSPIRWMWHINYITFWSIVSGTLTNLSTQYGAYYESSVGCQIEISLFFNKCNFHES